MATIKINVSGVMNNSPSINNSIVKVSSAKNGVSSLYWQIDNRIKSRRNIDSRLNNVIQSLENIQSQMEQMKSVVENGAGQYLSTENLLLSQIRGTVITSAFAASYISTYKGPIISNLMQFSLNGSKKSIDGGVLNNNILKKPSVGILDSKVEIGLNSGKKAEYKDDKNFYEKKQSNIFSKPYVYDKETGQYSIPELTKFAKQKGTIYEIKGEAKIEGSIIDAEGSISGEYGYGNASVKVGTAEAHANIAAGLYIYDKEGNTKLAPAVNAEIGASACIITTEAKGRIGFGEDNKTLGAYGNVEASAGKVEAKVKGSVSFFDKDGELDIQSQVKASAEAIAVEAKGSAGVSVLGTDLGVTGGVNVGIGAHAEAGIVDGKIKVDIGASIGVGVNLGFEIDASDTIDAICKSSTSIVDGIKKIF